MHSRISRWLPPGNQRWSTRDIHLKVAAMSGRKTKRDLPASSPELEALITLVDSGLTVEQIALRLGASVESIRDELTRLAISPKAPPRLPPPQWGSQRGDRRPGQE
jgi:DNA-binding NarL/FixJ family response regulator